MLHQNRQTLYVCVRCCGCKSAPVNAWHARAPGGFPPAIANAEQSAHLQRRTQPTRKSLQTKGCKSACETGRGCTSVSHQNKPCVWFLRQQPAPQRKHSDELLLHRRQAENTKHTTLLPVCGLRVKRVERAKTCTRTGARVTGTKESCILVRFQTSFTVNQLRNDSENWGKKP